MKKQKTKAVLLVAPWCSGCEKTKPYFIETCKQYGMRYEVLDVEDNDGLKMSVKYGVRNVPTILFLNDSKEVGRACGNNGYLEIRNYVIR
jgi:thioredoxin 1